MKHIKNDTGSDELVSDPIADEDKTNKFSRRGSFTTMDSATVTGSEYWTMPFEFNQMKVFI